MSSVLGTIIPPEQRAPLGWSGHNEAANDIYVPSVYFTAPLINNAVLKDLSAETLIGELSELVQE